MTITPATAIDVKSVLTTGDLVVSYWLDDDLLVLASDCHGVQVAEWVQVGGLVDLIGNFADQLVDESTYPTFIAEAYRPYSDRVVTPSRPIRELLCDIFSMTVPDAVHSLAGEGRYQRLVICPDSWLHVLPFHLLTRPDFHLSLKGTWADGTCYAPSASSYVYACLKGRAAEPSLAVIGVGDTRDEEMQQEARAASEAIPFSSEVVSNLGDLQRLSGSADLLYLIAHGRTRTPSESGVNADAVSRWSLVFDGDAVGERDFYNKGIPLKKGAIVVLSACNVGQIMPGVAHEIEGLLNSLFYAGASTILAARWPVPSVTAAGVFGGAIQRLFKGHCSLSRALAEAIVDASERPEFVRLMAGPESDVFFWGPFALYGNGI